MTQLSPLFFFFFSINLIIVITVPGSEAAKPAKFSYVCNITSCKLQFEIDELMVRHVDTQLLNSFVISLNSALNSLNKTDIYSVEQLATQTIDKANAATSEFGNTTMPALIAKLDSSTNQLEGLQNLTVEVSNIGQYLSNRTSCLISPWAGADC